MAAQITLKPLKGQNFTVTVEKGCSIFEMKHKVAEKACEFPAASQRLIFRGKILDDNEVVSELGIMPDQFVVVMLTKAKHEQHPVTNVPATSQTPVSSPSVPEVELGAPVPQRASDTNVLMEGDREQEQRPDVEAAPSGAASALQSSAGNAQPFPNLDAVASVTTTAAASQPLPQVLADLKHSPQFASMARMLVQEPMVFKYLLPSLLQGNPDLARAIQDNLPAFLQMCQEVGSRPYLSEGNWDELLASNPELLEEMMPEIETQDPEMAEAIRSDPASFLAIFKQDR